MAESMVVNDNVNGFAARTDATISLANYIAMLEVFFFGLGYTCQGHGENLL